MTERSEHLTSKAEKINNSSSNLEECYFEMDGNEDCSSLWSIEDDTMFFAQGLKHHSAGKGKSVYVTWNENYLINFVFKTSAKTKTTTLTKVRIDLPVHDHQQEEVSNMLILEMNTLIYMKSGSVYYFSSVKSMHKVDWLNGVRCMSSCPLTQFSVIRLVNTFDHDVQDQKRMLTLEVYKDTPQLGKCLGNEVLRHSYDITFDNENVFNSDWIDEKYTLISLITDQNNIMFLKQLVQIGNIFRTRQEFIDMNINQEVHIFTISGNIFVLIGANASENEFKANGQVENYNIRLLNSYACSIECVHIDCEKNLLIVLMQSGHMDIWYKSKRMFGALLHYQHEVPNFLDYDYWPTNNVFFFTTQKEVLQLKIKMDTSTGIEKECIVKETRKCVGGMTTCTFVEELQQLICLSINNIFYRINFATEKENTSETNFENLNNLYALNLKRVSDLRSKAHIVNELAEQPKYLHAAIEKEFRKQQALALDSRSEIFKKLFQFRVEYHTNLPGEEYFDNDYVRIKTASCQVQQMHTKPIFCLIFMSLENKKVNISSTFKSTMWYLYISYLEESLQFHIPYQLFNNKLCFIVDIPLKSYDGQTLPKFSIDLLTFLNHRCHSICLKYNLRLYTNDKTYANLFSVNIKNLEIVQSPSDDVKDLLRRESNWKKDFNCDKFGYRLTHRCKTSKIILQNVMDKIKPNLPWSLDMDLKLYYQHQYLIQLTYDDADEILSICSNYPMGMLYIKLLVVHITQASNVDASSHNKQEILGKTICEIEDLCRSIKSYVLNSKPASMHLENLRNVYFKLRLEFCETLK